MTIPCHRDTECRSYKLGAILVAGIFCTAIGLGLAPPAHASQADEAAVRAAELEALRERIQELRRSVDADLTLRDRARAALRDSEQTVARQLGILREIDARLAAGRHELESLRRERRARDAELQSERDALAGQLRAAYALGRQERLKLLLNQEDPSAVGRMLVYHDYMNRARIARMDRVGALLARVAELEDGIAAETAALAREQARQRTALAALKQTRAERATAIAAIDRALADRGRRLQQLEADEQALVRLLESLASVLADVPAGLGAAQAFAELQGRLGWPAQGRLLSGFGETRAGGTRTRGMLISAAAGDAVRAVAYGRVAWAGWMPHYGNLLVLEHGDGYFSLYGHNQALLREVGEWVDAGDVVAQVGDSGGQQQAALYFELRRGRTPLNPQQWLAGRQ